MAARTTEAHELRLQNRALYEENAHLTDLARMLLSSPHFSSFLDDMNTSGMPAPNTSALAGSSQAQPPQQQQQQPAPLPSQPMQSNAPKEVNSNPSPQDFSMQQNPDVGMVMVPNQGIDVSAMGMNNGGWNSGIDMNYGNTPVFAVTEVPEGPPIGTDLLSGKPSPVDTYVPESPKENIPSLDCPPVTEGKDDAPSIKEPEIELGEHDSLFDAPVSSQPPDSFDGVQPSKESPTFELVIESDPDVAVSRLKQLCSSMEGAFQRVSKATSHL